MIYRRLYLACVTSLQAPTYWHNTATAIRNNQEIQIPYSKRNKLPTGIRLKEERGHPITLSRRETILKVIFVATDTRQPSLQTLDNRTALTTVTTNSYAGPYSMDWDGHTARTYSDSIPADRDYIPATRVMYTRDWTTPTRHESTGYLSSASERRSQRRRCQTLWAHLYSPTDHTYSRNQTHNEIMASQYLRQHDTICSRSEPERSQVQMHSVTTGSRCRGLARRTCNTLSQTNYRQSG